MSEILVPCCGVYLCSRTSCRYSKPCDDAFRVEVMRVDRRVVDDPRKIECYGGSDKWWYSEGTNHRIEDGKICRDMGYREEWAVRVDDILNFVDRYGQCVVSRNADGFYEIEIYDSWRE